MLAKPKHYLVHDPNSSLRAGDVISIVPGWRTSQHKRHVVKHIIAPYGVPIEERPPVPTLEERVAEQEEKRARKDERRTARRAERDATAREVREARTRGKEPAMKGLEEKAVIGSEVD
jgi:small subunit ribosomal protein S17